MERVKPQGGVGVESIKKEEANLIAGGYGWTKSVRSIRGQNG